MFGETREYLVEVAKSQASESDSVMYLLNYFLQNVEYNYAYLFCAMMQEDIYGMTDLKLSSVVSDNGSEWFFDRKTAGNSILFHEIVDSYEKSQDINIIREIVIRELEKHIDNNDIVKKEADTFIQSLLDNMSQKIVITPDIVHQYQETPGFDFNGLFDYLSKQNSLELDRSITAVLCDYLGDDNLHETMPPVIEDGVLKRGVCRDYADYLVDLLREVGIEAYRVDGTSELRHAWVAAKVDGNWKSIDLVRAVFIRDHYLGIPENQIPEDWLLNDFDVCFEMQPSRTISSVSYGDKVEILPEVLNIDNFNKDFFEDFLNSLKSNQMLS